MRSFKFGNLRPVGLTAACLLALACSSGGSGGSGSAGTSGPGTAGTTGAGGNAAGASGTGGSAGSGAGGSAGSAGTTGTAGQGGTATVGGRGGGTAGAGAGGTAGSAGGTSGSAGASGAAGATGGSAGGRGGAGAGAGRGGGGGSGGANSDGGVPSPVTPTMNGSRYRFAWGDVIMEVDASVGARVATLSLGGTDVIVPSTAAGKLDGGAMDPTTWGSVFWTSPRSAWTPVTWPPPPNIDNAAYTASISGGTHAVFNGMTDTSIGVAMAKDYSVDATSGWISIAYTIKATKAQKAAPWEVSRVPRGGLTFFPVPGASSVTNQVPLTIMQTGSSPTIVWFDDAAKTATSPNGDKLYADGSGGWTAYVLNGILFLKKFTDIPASAQPTGEGEVDVYPGNGFLEFEVEGPYTMIAANGSLPWSIQWKVVKVPSGTSITAGSTQLLNFVMQQLAM